MRQLRIYIDTSIVGGFFDVEFQEETKLLFKKLKNRDVIFVVSDLLDLELERAPEKVRNLLLKYNNDCFYRVEITQECEILAREYISEQVVGKTSYEDCLHIAIATINNVDVLVSWNFKHIVNLHRIKGYNSVNIKYGYNLLEIRSPKELINYEDK